MEWMALSTSARNKRTKVQNELPLSEPAQQLNNSKTMAIKYKDPNEE